MGILSACMEMNLITINKMDKPDRNMILFSEWNMSGEDKLWD